MWQNVRSRKLKPGKLYVAVVQRHDQGDGHRRSHRLESTTQFRSTPSSTPPPTEVAVVAFEALSQIKEQVAFRVYGPILELTLAPLAVSPCHSRPVHVGASVLLLQAACRHSAVA